MTEQEAADSETEARVEALTEILVRNLEGGLDIDGAVLDLLPLFEEYEKRGRESAAIGNPNWIFEARDAWQARALRAEAAISDIAERSTADAMYWKDKCLKAEAALREIIGLYVGSNPEMARARDIARAALPQDKGE